jgi:type IV pilus assembly protein PilB
MPPRKQLLGQIIKGLGVGVHEGMIQEALMTQKSEGGQIGQILVRMGHVTEAELTLALGMQAGLEVVDLDATPPDPALVAQIDHAMAEMFAVCPVRMDGDKMVVAVSNPQNLSVLDDLRFVLNCELVPALADEAQIKRAIKGGGGGGSEATARAAAEALEGADDENVNAAPVVKLLNYIILQAVKDKASDIHLEPFETDFKVRYRVDGVLYELEPPPPHLATALISRVKVKSGLDIAETRLPQDGRIDMSIAGRNVDLRVSTLPTMFGESCVMRVLDRSVISLDLDQVGMRPDELVAFRKLVAMPHGIVLVTGPTGSGKTTTLYSALNEANDPDTKIITTEDPVEYDLDGIIQVQVNEEAGLTYGRALRAILRQDPDTILVGEIRDKETSSIAIEAALTGHLVFSTVHTNDAPLAVTRMIDLGVEPFLLTATLEAIVAQRLVRKVCTRCKVMYDPSDDVLMEIGLTPADVAGKQFAYGKGCDTCHFTGFKGRTAIFETLLLTIFDGLTTVEEVLRATIDIM